VVDNINNSVNDLLNKPRVTFDEIKNKYTDNPAYKIDNNLLIIAILVVIIIAIITYVKCFKD